MSEASSGSLLAVLPRFGPSLGGGAETLVRSLLVELLKQGPEKTGVKHIEVFTTCARDHRTWANELEPGTTEDSGIIVQRFPVDARDLEIFIGAEHKLSQGFRLSKQEQLDWLQHSVNSRALYAKLYKESHRFEALLFAPYLFATSFWGSLIDPKRSIVFPCLHNEAYAYLDVFYTMFSQVRGLSFNAGPERELARALYPIEDLDQKSEVVGMGFDPLAIDTRHSTAHRPYLLYSGRKETGKNLHLVLEYFGEYKRHFPDSPLEFHIIGAGSIDFVDELPPGVMDHGFVSEEEKFQRMRDAVMLVQPSTNESFSIVLMESWLVKTPVLVHGECAVTRDHVLRSGGGLYFTSAREFVGAVDEVFRNRSLAERMGEAGAAFVASEYSWDAVIGRFLGLLQKTGLRSIGSDSFEAVEKESGVAQMGGLRA